MITATYSEVESVVVRLKHKFFTGRMDLNLIGIRLPNPSNDGFDDTLAVAYVDELKNKRVDFFPITTEPGLKYLTNPINVKGTAILVPGQYRGMWTLGKHKGHDALVQVNPCTVSRDNNKNIIRDYASAVKETGLFGINLHSVDPLEFQTIVGAWSAGCQVLPIKADKASILSLVRRQLASIGTASVSYTLVMESDF